MASQGQEDVFYVCGITKSLRPYSIWSWKPLEGPEKGSGECKVQGLYWNQRIIAHFLLRSVSAYHVQYFFTSQLLSPSCFFAFFSRFTLLPFSPLLFFIFFSLTYILFSPQSPHTPSVHWLLTTDGQNNGPCHTALRQTICWWEEGCVEPDPW